MTLTAESLRELSFILLGAGSLAMFIAFRAIRAQTSPDSRRVFIVGIATVISISLFIPAFFILFIKT